MKKDIRKKLHEEFGIDPRLIDGFIVDFMLGFRENVDALNAQRDNPDMMEVRRQTHMIIGYAANGGAMDLHNLAVALNSAAKIPDPALVSSLIDRVANLYSLYEAEA